MNSGNIKTKNSRIPLLWKSGMVLIGLIFASFVFAQIPYEEGKVYVCPLATDKNEVNPRCDCRIDLVVGETVTSTCPVNGESYELTLTITEYGGDEFYAILGFVNGGAGVNSPPQAKILAPSEGYVGQEILFNDSQSSDPNDDPLYFYWDFGDGGKSTNEKTSHIYRNPGEYLITLTVDDGMASSTATTTIKILSPPSPPPSGFVYFGKEKIISTEEKIGKKKIEIPQKEITQEIKKPEKITKILKIERPKEKDEKAVEGKIPEGKKEIKAEVQIPLQNFPPLFLASLKETITTPSIIIPATFSIFALIFVLLREIKMLKRK
jgi:PKD repeat protein